MSDKNVYKLLCTANGRQFMAWLNSGVIWNFIITDSSVQGCQSSLLCIKSDNIISSIENKMENLDFF